MPDNYSNVGPIIDESNFGIDCMKRRDYEANSSSPTRVLWVLKAWPRGLSCSWVASPLACASLACAVVRSRLVLRPPAAGSWLGSWAWPRFCPDILPPLWLRCSLFLCRSGGVRPRLAVRAARSLCASGRPRSAPAALRRPRPPPPQPGFAYRGQAGPLRACSPVL